MELLSFKFENNSIRTLIIENEPWFVLKDVGDVLGLTNHKQALSDLKKRLQKISVNLEEVRRTYPLQTSGGMQSFVCLSEIGLYELIFASNKLEAIRFRYWVTREVLPSIRKTGNYSITQKQTPIFDTSSFSNEKLLDVQKTLLGLETAIKILKVSEASKLLMTETIYRELGIKTNFLPKYSDEKHTYSLTYLLKKFGSKISAQKVNQKLLEIGILEIKTRKSHKKEKISQMLLELEFNNIDENNKSETILEFKSLTEKGLKFGKNLINPNNELQTQPQKHKIQTLSYFFDLITNSISAKIIDKSIWRYING